jgi:aspartate 1-decarboxylase
MRRTMFKSKIHRATVTQAELNYEGSLTIDQDLLDAADILPFEQIHVWDVTNGTRLTTYALSGPRGSGVICVNGAGAHLIQVGNTIIIATFTVLRTKELKRYRPTVVFVDKQNKIKDGPDDTVEVLPVTEPVLHVAPVAEQSTEASPKPRRTRRKA